METNTESTNINHDTRLPLCPVCNNPLLLRIANGRKSGKPFIMLMCAHDGRHFRGFIGDRTYIRQVLDRMQPANPTEGRSQL